MYPSEVSEVINVPAFTSGLSGMLSLGSQNQAPLIIATDFLLCSVMQIRRMLTRGINCNLFNNIKDNLRAIIKKTVLNREIPAMMVRFVEASDGLLIAALQL